MNYLNDTQRIQLGELASREAGQYQATSLTVVNNVYGAGTGGNIKGGSVTALSAIGAALAGLLAYSIYAGQPFSTTITQIETAISGGNLLEQAQTLWVEVKP